MWVLTMQTNKTLELFLKKAQIFMWLGFPVSYFEVKYTQYSFRIFN